MICSIDGCDRESYCKALCRAHYESMRRQSPRQTPVRTYQRNVGLQCRASECERKAHTTGLCETHYKYSMLGRPIDNPIRENVRNVGLTCSVDGCDYAARARGMCYSHYARSRRESQRVDAPIDRRRRAGSTCTIDGCERVSIARGLCRAHYMRAYRGSTGDYEIGGYRSSRRCTKLWRAEVLRRAGILHINFRREAERQAGYNLAQAAEILGVVPQSVSNWIRFGWLRAEYPWSAYRQRPSISEDAIIKFLRERGALMVAIRPTDAVIAAFVSEARADLMRRYISRKHLADILCYSINTISSLVARYQMPPPAIDLGANGGGMWYDRAKIRAWLDTCPGRWTAAARRELQAIDRPHALCADCTTSEMRAKKFKTGD